MIEKEKKVISGSILENNVPEEVFTEGFCDLIVYGDIVKFNIFSRPIHSKDAINKRKINKTLTFTINNFENFIAEINSEYEAFKLNQKKISSDATDDLDVNKEVIPPKGNRVL
jgi:hypothetical protein